MRHRLPPRVDVVKSGIVPQPDAEILVDLCATFSSSRRAGGRISLMPILTISASTPTSANTSLDSPFDSAHGRIFQLAAARLLRPSSLDPSASSAASASLATTPSPRVSTLPISENRSLTQNRVTLSLRCSRHRRGTADRINQSQTWISSWESVRLYYIVDLRVRVADTTF